MPSEHFLVVATAWGSRHGGINSFNATLCEELCRAGQKVTCFIADAGSDDIAAAAAAGVTLVGAEEARGLSAGERLLLDPSSPVSSVDYVVGHGRITGPQAFRLRKRLVPSADYIHFVHMHADTIDGEKEPPTDTEQTKERMLTELWHLGHAVLPVAVGSRLKALYTPEFAVQFPDRSIHEFVPGLVDFPGESQASTHPTQRILIVARPEDSKLKGIDYAVKRVASVFRTLQSDPKDASANILANRIQVYVVGAATKVIAAAEESRLKREFQSLRVKPYSADRAEIALEFRAAGLVLMLSTEEGFGLSALEALSVGTPVLVSGRSGLAETLQTLGSGHEQHYVVHLGSQSADSDTENAIKDVLQNLGDHRMRTEALRAAYAARYSWRNSITGFLEALRAARSGPPPAPGRSSSKPEHSTGFEIVARLLESSENVLATIEVPKTQTWISRPEESELRGILNESPTVPIALLGAPGSGKSALIARVARSLITATSEDQSGEVTTLVVKADLLPATVCNLAELSHHLGFSSELPDIVREVASFNRVVVFVDQLDALSALVDRRPERLAVVLELIEQLSRIPNVTVIFSCRTFEFELDPRFMRLKARRLELHSLTEADVANALERGGIAPSDVAPGVLHLLRNPEWLTLAMGLRQFGRSSAIHDEGSLVASYLERTYARAADAARCRTDVARVAELIDRREELWLPVSFLESEHVDVSALISLGILRATQDLLRVSLAHQVLFERLRAVQLVAQGSLSDYVKNRDGSAFVRPLLRPTLKHLRLVDRDRYHRELDELFALANLRAFLRRELLECIGSADDPTEAEMSILCEHLQNARWANWALEAIRARPTWFARLGDIHLGPMLRESPFRVLPVLQAAVLFDQKAVRQLVVRHVLPQLEGPNKEPIARFLGWLLQTWEPWDENAQELATSLVRASSSITGSEPLGFLLHALLQRAPSSGLLLLCLWIDRHVTDAATTLQALEAWWPPDGVSENSSSELVREVFPRVTALLEQLREPAPLGRYASSRDVHWELTDDDVALGRDLRRGIQTVAKTEPTAFLDFARRYSASDLAAVHTMIAEALIGTTAEYLQFCEQYLLSDERRLRLGHWEPAVTLRLLMSLRPHLDANGKAALKTRFDEFEFRIPQRQDPEDEERRRKENQEWRELYLEAVDQGSNAARAEDLEELLSSAANRNKPTFGAIGSPVPVETLARMEDDEMLLTFAEFPDSTGWHHPTDWLKGGSVELSRALATLVPTDPVRFAALARRFSSETHARPATEIFSALAKSELPLQEFESLFDNLSKRGVFHDEERRSRAAYAWSDRSTVGAKPSEGTIATLVSWLRHTEPKPQGDHSEEVETKRDPAHSMLLRGGEFGILPDGNYPILHALTAILTRGPDPRMDEWATILEDHVHRAESTSVWRAVSRTLSWLAQHDSARGERLVDTVFAGFPGVLGSVNGVCLIAAMRWYVPSAAVARWMRQLLETQWSRAEQGYGELLATAAFLPDAGDAPKRELKELMAVSASADRRAGAIHILAHMWDSASRTAVTDLLVAAADIADQPFVSDALSAVFHQQAFFADHDTDRFLEAVTTKAPNLLRTHNATYLPERLLALLPHNPDGIYNAINLYVTSHAHRSLYHGGAELVGIALFLQRLGGSHRAQGLDLLDQLFEGGLREAEEFVKTAGT